MRVYRWKDVVTKELISIWAESIKDAERLVQILYYTKDDLIIYEVDMEFNEEAGIGYIYDYNYV